MFICLAAELNGIKAEMPWNTDTGMYNTII